MKKVLWVSQHQLDNEAIEELKKEVNDEVEVITKNVVFDSDGKTALHSLLKLVTEVDAQILGGVFPVQLWFKLVHKAVMLKNSELEKFFVVISVPAEAKDGKRIFKFDHIEIINLKDTI